MEGVGGKGRVVGDGKCFDWSMEGAGRKGRVGIVTVLIGQWKEFYGKGRVVGDSKCFDWSMEGVGWKWKGSRG